jgi:hypothetical protein
MRPATDDPGVEPVLIKLIDPAIEQRMARWAESRFTREIRSEETPADRPAPLTEGETTAAGTDGSPGEDRQAAAAEASGRKALPSSGAKQKRPRGPRRISKVQTAIVILQYRAKKELESIRVEDIAKEAKCSAQNLYKSPEFMSALKAARAWRIERGWKIEGVADRPDDSTLEVDES